jgi:hypothetical protein
VEKSLWKRLRTRREQTTWWWWWWWWSYV